MNKHNIASIISDERKTLRDELTATVKSVHQCVFSSVAIFAVLSGIHLNKDLAINQENKATILMILSQLVFFLSLFSIMLNASITNIGDYIAALEKKINLLAGEEITFWETRMVRHFWKPNTPFFWSVFILSASLMGLLIWSFIIVLYNTAHVTHLIIICIETLIVIFIYIWIHINRKNNREFALSIINETDNG